jgi:ectoine hydroxylase-related dioxygenase (phytanoyl-CoA dioxygenase family)
MERFVMTDKFEDMSSFFHKNGYIVIEKAVPDPILQGMKSDLKRLDQSSQKKKDRHTMHKCFFEHSPKMVEFIENSRLVDFIQYLIADVPGNRGNSLSAHLIHNNAFIVPPNGRGQAPSWHTDDPLQNVILPEGSEPLPESIKLPVLVVTGMLWLSNCTKPENGPTYVVPKSHRFGKPVDAKLAEKLGIPTCAPAGSVALMSSQTWHRGCENTSEIPRETVQITFGRRMIGHKFKTIMNYKMPDHVLRNKTDKKTLERFGFLQGGAYS